eukprot:366458-Chlamydomonas_euryale.AAC.20
MRGKVRAVPRGGMCWFYLRSSHPCTPAPLHNRRCRREKREQRLGRRSMRQEKRNNSKEEGEEEGRQTRGWEEAGARSLREARNQGNRVWSRALPACIMCVGRRFGSE